MDVFVAKRIQGQVVDSPDNEQKQGDDDPSGPATAARPDRRTG